MAHHDPEIRKLTGTKVRYEQLAQQTPAERSAIIEKSWQTRRLAIENQIDPENQLDPVERARRAAWKIRADMAAKSLLAAKARREKAAARRAAEAEAELDAILAAEAGIR